MIPENAICAMGCRLAPILVMRAMVIAGHADTTLAYAKMHEAQRVAWLSCAVLLQFTFNPNEFPDIDAPITIGGVPIHVDNTMRTDQVLFCDAKGNVVSWIEALAVPYGFDGENADKPYHTAEEIE
jgi:hypothetical protein